MEWAMRFVREASQPRNGIGSFGPSPRFGPRTCDRLYFSIWNQKARDDAEKKQQALSHASKTLADEWWCDNNMSFIFLTSDRQCRRRVSRVFSSSNDLRLADSPLQKGWLFVFDCVE